ncbi:MAG: hypothetical protein BWX80_01351 [Candidatus Hydrogenedentes bacterium ADurb.Bin101]|nr:MAG: hypothetical protein BWX80_01351 [Candidatus Hydrogenedentes bacterium ADurb.Bin101]
MGVFVIGAGLLDITFEAVDRQIHLGQADGGGVLFQAIEGKFLGGVLVPPLDHACALDEHAARAAGRVQHRAAFGFQDIGDQRDQRDGGEELTAVVGFLIGELGQEILVDTTEHVTGDALEFFRIKRTQKLTEDLVVEFLIFALGQDTAQVLVVGLNGFHRVDDGLGAVRAIGQGHQRVELGFGLQEDSALLREVFLCQGARLAAAFGQIGFDAILDAEVAAVGMPEKHQAHDGQEILVASVVRVRPQRIRRAPEPLFNRFDVLELSHACSFCST